MEDLMKSEIFFFVATVLIVAVGFLMIIALVYFLRILSDIKYISKHVRNEGVAFFSDMRTVLTRTVTDLPKVIGILGILAKMFGFMKEKRAKKRSTKRTT